MTQNADSGRVIAYRCEDCHWRWPLRKKPSPDAECDNCGGAFEAVHEWDGLPMDTAQIDSSGAT